MENLVKARQGDVLKLQQLLGQMSVVDRKKVSDGITKMNVDAMEKARQAAKLKMDRMKAEVTLASPSKPSSPAVLEATE